MDTPTEPARWRTAEALAIVSASTIVLSTIYVHAYSLAADFPLYSFLSVDSLLMLALPWLGPSAALWLLAWVAGVTTGRAGWKVDDADRFSFWGHAILVGLTALGSVLWFMQGLPRSVLAMLWATPIVYLWLDFLKFTVWGNHVLLFAGERGRALVVVGPLVIAASISIGITDGKYGGRFLFKKMEVEIETRDEAKRTVGRIAFALADFVVVRESQTLEVILIPRVDVKRVQTYARNDAPPVVGGPSSLQNSSSVNPSNPAGNPQDSQP